MPFVQPNFHRQTYNRYYIIKSSFTPNSTRSSRHLNTFGCCLLLICVHRHHFRPILHGAVSFAAVTTQFASISILLKSAGNTRSNFRTFFKMLGPLPKRGLGWAAPTAPFGTPLTTDRLFGISKNVYKSINLRSPTITVLNI